MTQQVEKSFHLGNSSGKWTGFGSPEASTPASYELSNFDCILNLPGAPFPGVVQKLEAKSGSHADLGLESQDNLF